MPISVLVLGADGRLGRRVRGLLADAAVDVVAVGADARAEEVGVGDVVVNAATDDEHVVRSWSRAGSRARGYVDAGPAGATHRIVAPVGPAPVVPGAGWLAGIGDALAVVAAGRLVGPDRADVTGWVPARRSLLARATPRERAALWRALAHPMHVLVDGRPATEPVAGDRRLAWFPRPVGPHHAAAVPGAQWRTLPRVLPSLRTVRTALAMRSSSAELLQALGTLDRLRPRADRRVRGPDRGTADERWAIVAEVATAGGDLARAWANGHDRHGVAAHVVARVARELGAHAVTTGGGPAAAGVTEVVGAEQLLDDLAALTDLRWSVSVG